MSRKQREDLAATRIMRVLSSLTMANQRTLEQKISDAGPYNQRIDRRRQFGGLTSRAPRLSVT